MKWTATALTGIALLTSFCITGWSLSSSGASASNETLEARVFEMRTYYTHPGRLTHLHDRFRDHTNYLFVKHGMTLVGYWTPVEQKDTLVYILAFPSREARDKSFDAFRNDPAWQAAFAGSHKKAGGKIVKKVESQFLDPTDYSPIR